MNSATGVSKLDNFYYKFNSCARNVRVCTSVSFSGATNALVSSSELICPSRVPNYRFKQSSPFRQFPARIYHASKNSPSSFTYQEFTCPTVNCARPVYYYTLAKKASESSTSVKQKGVGSYPIKFPTLRCRPVRLPHGEAR